MENVVEGRFPRHEAAATGERSGAAGDPSAGAAPGDPAAAPVEEAPPAEAAVAWPTREPRPGGGAAWA